MDTALYSIVAIVATSEYSIVAIVAIPATVAIVANDIVATIMHHHGN